MDRALVERAQRGDRQAYERLAGSVARQLFLIAHRILRDPDQAEDAVQQALVSIWRELPNLRDPDRFEAWAHRLIVRASIDEVRRRKAGPAAVRSIPETEPATPDDSERFADRDALERAFRRLSPDHRAVVVLHLYVGLSLAEVAETLEIPYGTVGSRLHYATRQLREAIEADGRAPVSRGQPA